MYHPLLIAVLLLLGVCSIARGQETLHRSDDEGRIVPRKLADLGRRWAGLYKRQDTCQSGSEACESGGCCLGSCCGNGCCPVGYSCHFVGDTPGCCPPDRLCSKEVVGCSSPGLVVCNGFNHCCRVGEVCGLDTLGNAQCGGQPAPESSTTSIAPEAINETTSTTPTISVAPTTSEASPTLVASEGVNETISATAAPEAPSMTSDETWFDGSFSTTEWVPTPSEVPGTEWNPIPSDIEGTPIGG